jgi:hypothetical protein
MRQRGASLRPRSGLVLSQTYFVVDAHDIEDHASSERIPAAVREQFSGKMTSLNQSASPRMRADSGFQV